jgi:hydrogenase maturation protein HypF
MSEKVVRRALRVTGVVQGVGYRPFVHATATSLGLAGLVGNDPAGVFVEVEGPPADVDTFVARLSTSSPALASVESVLVHDLDVRNEAGFAIVASRDGDADVVALVPPDTASCAECLAEVDDPADRRYRYPFTACTYCGPRYTLVTGVPYDRPSTTMAAFPLCEDCAREYADPADRRFHAQPTACPVCGPQLWFRRTSDTREPARGDAALAAALRTIHGGGIVAVKGVGGYHLMCSALDVDAVDRLRERKRRGGKPFAVLARDLEAASRLVALDPMARSALVSPQAPIVICRADPREAYLDDVVQAVAPGVGTVGVLLPYSPLHHLLMSPHPELPGVEPPPLLVATSGNLADEPICIDPDEAEERLAEVADAFLHHDRPIHVACDDSVLRVVDGRVQPVRRSRGYAPLPVTLPMTTEPVLAVGGELKTTACLASGRRAWMSQHIGDTENLETLAMLDRTVTSLGALARVTPAAVVADAHPGYLSRRWAQQYAGSREIPLVLVQHHHAHLAALLAEHGVVPDDRVLGMVLDGTGWGSDGTIWGGELLLGSYRRVLRVGHLATVALPGGDAAARRPARSALAHLHAAGVHWDADLAPVAACGERELAAVASMLRSGAACTPTSSTGRLFDAMASLLGIRQDAEYEGQAAMELEAAATAAPTAWPMRLPVREAGGILQLDPATTVRDAVAGRRAGIATGAIALGFHEALARALSLAAIAVRSVTGTATVGLTGGVFQNAWLTEACRGRLEDDGFRVLVHEKVPPNDGGLALGQVAVAAAGGGTRTTGHATPTERTY